MLYTGPCLSEIVGFKNRKLLSFPARSSPGLYQTTSLVVHRLSMPLKKESESEVVQSYLTLCDPMDCSLSGSSIHGIFQAKVLEWVAISFSRGSSQLRYQTWVSHIVGRRFTVWVTREVLPLKKVLNTPKLAPSLNKKDTVRPCDNCCSFLIVPLLFFFLPFSLNFQSSEVGFN